MEPENATRFERRHSEQSDHDDEQVRESYKIVVQERDDLRQYVSELEEQVLPRFDVNGTNLAEVFVTQKNKYLERVISLEGAIVEVEATQSYEIQRAQREKTELQHQYDELYQKTFGQNGYRDRLESAHVALELANDPQPPDVVELIRQLAHAKKERDEFDHEARRLGAWAEELKLNWNASMDDVEKLRKQNEELTNLQDSSVALQEANKEIERLRGVKEIEDSYRVEASKREVLRLQEEKIAWEEDRRMLEGRAAELSLTIRTLEDMLAASEAQKSSDVEMSDVGDNESVRSSGSEILGDAVWRQWSERLWNHIQAKPQAVEGLFRLAAANLYRPGGALPDVNPGAESSSQQFPGVTWVKELIDLVCHRPVASLVEESTWREWANEVNDFVLNVPPEISVLYRLAGEGQQLAGAEWIRQLIAFATQLPSHSEHPRTLKEYQLNAEIKEARARIEELERGEADRDEAVGHTQFLNATKLALEQELEAANKKIADKEQEIDGITGQFEDEIEQLNRSLKNSYEQKNLFKGLYEKGKKAWEENDEIKKLQRDLEMAYERGNHFVQLYERGKALSDEHEDVWKQKFDKEVAGADKHAAGLVEEAETLQGRLNGAHGVIAQLENEVARLRSQLTERDAVGSGSGPGIAVTAPPEGPESTSSHRTLSTSSHTLSEEEESASEELKIAKTDLYNTLEEVEELKLKLGFADRAHKDMKEEFERKINTLENNAKEEVTEKERIEEKLRIAEERLQRRVEGEIRRLEREGLLDAVVGEGNLTGKGRKAAPGALKPKTKVPDDEELESPPITPLESPLESPDILMKDDHEYIDPKEKKGKAKKKKVQAEELSEAGSEGATPTRRSTRETRNKQPVYKVQPLKVLLGRRKSSAGNKRKTEEKVEGGGVAEGDVGNEELGDANDRERGKIKRRGSKMV
ncbi:uncharacterized protein EAE98_000150 [Botrytis deweyae]|uniref:Uncharacterized protein n=1 Tax=Botrytis deweyae TaxID=2478750 RepID=A0ABQ7J2U2_9HELO|nr:uncharacterized protein EAE98_000150 [Botrytis deweyae]KAF7940023.1 hypothetical protein EAE98_000150 [Botrytis deweyae]